MAASMSLQPSVAASHHLVPASGAQRTARSGMREDGNGTGCTASHRDMVD
jgi:hypothetical protein